MDPYDFIMVSSCNPVEVFDVATVMVKNIANELYERLKTIAEIHLRH